MTSINVLIKAVGTKHAAFTDPSSECHVCFLTVFKPLSVCRAYKVPEQITYNQGQIYCYPESELQKQPMFVPGLTSNRRATFQLGMTMRYGRFYRNGNVPEPKCDRRARMALQLEQDGCFCTSLNECQVWAARFGTTAAAVQNWSCSHCAVFKCWTCSRCLF